MNWFEPIDVYAPEFAATVTEAHPRVGERRARYALLLAIWIAGYVLVNDLSELRSNDIARCSPIYRRCSDLEVRRVAWEILEDAGWLQADPEHGDNVHGVPKRWRVNFRVHEHFPDHAARERATRTARRDSIAANVARIRAERAAATQEE